MGIYLPNNLLDRTIERELVPLCQAYGIGIIPWGPLAGGFLTGKYRKGEKPSPEWRLNDGGRNYGNLFTESNWDKLSRLDDFAAQRGHRLGELAIAWLLAKPWVATVISGAREVEQVAVNVAAAQWKLKSEEVAEVDALSAGA